MLAVATGCTAVCFGAGPPPVRAMVANTTQFPLDSSVFFVLDDTISSKESSGTIARAHLRDPIILDGVTIAAAGTPVLIEVTHASAAQMGNVDGSVDIFFEPLQLADGKTLPLVTPTSHLDPQMSAGAQSTRGVTDTVGDIFIPYHVLYHVLRKGSDVTLKRGTVIRARTGAALHVARGVLVMTTPAPLVTSADTPHPAFMPEPLATPPGYIPPAPKPTPSIHATPTP